MTCTLRLACTLGDATESFKGVSDPREREEVGRRERGSDDSCPSPKPVYLCTTYS